MTTQSTKTELRLARPLAAEDLARGDFVAVLSEVHEFPSFFWCCDTELMPPHEPVRVQWRSPEGGLPLKVVDLCLPYVFAKDPCGTHRTLDLGRE